MTAKKTQSRTSAKKPQQPSQKKGKPAARIVAAKPEVPAPAKPVVVVKSKLSAKEKQDCIENLLALRARLTGQITALKDDSLTREPSENTIEDGTDAFERQVSLNLASAEQESILAIDEAVRRVAAGMYGVCEDCGQMVEKARLKALPFVRLCVKCQSEAEKGKTRYRPLQGDTSF